MTLGTRRHILRRLNAVERGTLLVQPALSRRVCRSGTMTIMTACGVVAVTTVNIMALVRAGEGRGGNEFRCRAMRPNLTCGNIAPGRPEMTG